MNTSAFSESNAAPARDGAWIATFRTSRSTWWAGLRRSGWTGPRLDPFDPGWPDPERSGDSTQHELLVEQAQPPVKIDGIPLAKPAVADASHDRGSRIQRGQLALGGGQVIAIHHAAHGELVHRHPLGDEVAQRVVPALDA